MCFDCSVVYIEHINEIKDIEAMEGDEHTIRCDRCLKSKTHDFMKCESNYCKYCTLNQK